MTLSSRRIQVRACGFNETTNAGLWLDKFICNQGRDADCSDKDLRDQLKRRLPKSRLVAETAAVPSPQAYSRFYYRWLAALKAISAECWLAQVQGRMSVGLGDEAVLETSVALHHTYGVPFIPGSALKGLVASYTRHRLDGWVTRDNNGKSISVSRPYEVIFGKMEQAGYITFHDALYVPGSADGQPLRADVITVHHPAYYRNEKDAAPADWDDPNPVPFLSATGDYLIALSVVPGCELWLEPVWQILKLALEHEGIGAKTSSGYGRMELREA